MRDSGLAIKLGALSRRARWGMLLGLDRVRGALESVGAPHVGIACVHVAGSNGKGSTCAMVESIAREAGLRTGLYTSPHLSRFAERIRIAGEPIGDAAFDRALGMALKAEGAPGLGELTFFEVLTIAAFIAFREAGVDLAVLEVGLGGRLDATNVVEAPLVTAITSIALEHSEVLGRTEALIAREKAGILKRGAPSVLGPLSAEASGAIDEVVRAVGAGPVRRIARGERPDVEVSLAGPHQGENAAVAAAIAGFLVDCFPAIGGAVGRGLGKARWPGRFERFDRPEWGGVRVILDCAHNPHGAAALAATLEAEGIEPSSVHLVFGALADKEWREMLRILAPRSGRRYYTSPRGRSPAPLSELAGVAEGEELPSPKEALARAMGEARRGQGTTVLVAGSIYLVGEIRAALLGEEADPVIAL